MTGLVACNQDKLLVAPTPDVVLPKDISGAAALPSAYRRGDRRFPSRYAGGYGSGLDLNEGLAQISGLLADELINAETFNTRIEIDRRATKAINATTLQTFQDIQRARATADLVAAASDSSIRPTRRAPKFRRWPRSRTYCLPRTTATECRRAK